MLEKIIFVFKARLAIDHSRTRYHDQAENKKDQDDTQQYFVSIS
jgi:hypothetical protein